MERHMADCLERDRLMEMERARKERLLRMRERESLRDLERSARDENARRLEAEYAANVSRLEAEYARKMERERWEREREQLNQNRLADFGERLMPHVLNVAGQLIGSYFSSGSNLPTGADLLPIKAEPLRKEGTPLPMAAHQVVVLRPAGAKLASRPLRNISTENAILVFLCVCEFFSLFPTIPFVRSLSASRPLYRIYSENKDKHISLQTNQSGQRFANSIPE